MTRFNPRAFTLSQFGAPILAPGEAQRCAQEPLVPSATGPYAPTTAFGSLPVAGFRVAVVDGSDREKKICILFARSAMHAGRNWVREDCKVEIWLCPARRRPQRTGPPSEVEHASRRVFKEGCP